ncbi:MAG: UDP-N-acetylglucosamine--N-acetylmuramyl-(pentapeptide) pyrophosphoryl-undecaprenol N-acetylglucosamine transferase [Clostridia bacterium]|nr:UDP-N-acetylglucosamine--N-acetylmuramyl-(pentapeptide) pyrophosphoryl-undecaprenol N-acetylglucosamine transferase [Clostridia bacterium]
MSSIVLTGGGTAGHAIPNLAILPYIHDSFDNICYIGREIGIERNLLEKYTDYFSIPTVKFKREICADNLLIPFKLFEAVKKSKEILKKIKPKVVFSKGGYVSLPVCIAAKQLKIPIICHESDLTLGLANKITAKFSDKVLTSYFETAQNLKNAIYTGAPIREGLFYADKNLALRKFGFSGQKKVILIFGGSSGSKSINNLTRQVLDKLLEKYAILHICGNDNKLTYSTENEYFQAEFVDDMASCYKACDVAVSRGGANALFELIALKIPSLIIPLSKSSRNDQVENAEYFKKRGMCNVALEKNLNANFYIQEIEKLIKNQEKIKNHIINNRIAIGNEKIAEILRSYAK